MNFFLEQGRCRVCNKILCCSDHQKQHERAEHEEYSYWLEILPISCRACGKRISTIHDLNSKCILFNKHHFAEGTFAGTPRPSRKRRISAENALEKSVFVRGSPNHTRKKKCLIPSYKPKLKKAAHTPNLVQLFDLGAAGVRIGDAAFDAIISPQLSISYKILESVTKSSTPLGEDDKENIATLVSVSVKNDIDVVVSETWDQAPPSACHDVTSYHTPECWNSAGTSLILVSALKRSAGSPARSLKNGDGRRVSFGTTTSPSDSEISIYTTPMVTTNSSQINADSAVCDHAVGTYQIVTLSPTAIARNENIESVFQLDADISNEPCQHTVAKMARNMRLKLGGIPRSLSSMWEWTQRRIRRKSQRDEFDSPVSKRNKMKATLKRRPISSYWVSMSITSLVREPLPNYKEKYSVVPTDQ